MSRLCRLKNASHGEDGQWAYNEIVSLRQERDELLSVFSLVINELEKRDRGNGNAPGHGHDVPGIWDSDNGDLAGKPCAWCAMWNKAKELSSTIARAKANHA